MTSNCSHHPNTSHKDQNYSKNHSISCHISHLFIMVQNCKIIETLWYNWAAALRLIQGLSTHQNEIIHAHHATVHVQDHSCALFLHFWQLDPKPFHFKPTNSPTLISVIYTLYKHSSHEIESFMHHFWLQLTKISKTFISSIWAALGVWIKSLCIFWTYTLQGVQINLHLELKARISRGWFQINFNWIFKFRPIQDLLCIYFARGT